MEELTLAVALKKHIFGEDCKSSVLLQELRQLTPEDKQWFKDQFEKEGLCKIKTL